jgi:hypothetical protein
MNDSPQQSDDGHKHAKTNIRIGIGNIWIGVGVLIVTMLAALMAYFGLGKPQRVEFIYGIEIISIWLIPAVAAAIASYWVYQFGLARGKAKAEILSKTEPAGDMCAIATTCVIREAMDLWPHDACANLAHEVQVFNGLKTKKLTFEVKDDDLTRRQTILQSNAQQSWHLLYLTYAASVEYVTQLQLNWLGGANTTEASRANEKRILVVRERVDEDLKYREHLNMIVAKARQSSQLKIITDTALVRHKFSDLLRDYGIFRDKTDSKLQVIMNFNLCDFADVFAVSRGHNFLTADQDYASSLIKRFEGAWGSPDLNKEFEICGLRYGRKT